MGDQTTEIAEVRKKALEKFHEQTLAYPYLLTTLSTENLANLIYDRERTGLTDNEIYISEIQVRIGYSGDWEKIKTHAMESTPPNWSEAFRHYGHNPEQRIRRL